MCKWCEWKGGGGGTLSQVCAKTQKDEHEADYVAGLHKNNKKHGKNKTKKEHGKMRMKLTIVAGLHNIKKMRKRKEQKK